jgi:hypothetical protein
MHTLCTSLRTITVVAYPQTSSVDAPLRSLGPVWLPSNLADTEDPPGPPPYPSPPLLCIETVSVMDGGGLLDRPEETGGRGGRWLLERDAVHSHMLHMMCPSRCAVYIVSCPWLASLIEDQKKAEVDYREDQEEHHHQQQQQQQRKGEEVVPSFVSSHVLPVYCPQMVTSPDSAPPTLSGVVVTYDPLTGHVACFITSAGQAGTVNLQAHIQFCESQLALQVCVHS